jgi:hypothetical protein
MGQRKGKRELQIQPIEFELNKFRLFKEVI